MLLVHPSPLPTELAVSGVVQQYPMSWKVCGASDSPGGCVYFSQKLLALLPPAPACGDCRRVPPRLVYAVLGEQAQGTVRVKPASSASCSHF